MKRNEEKKAKKKLSIKREVVRSLTNDEMTRVAGGSTTGCTTNSCGTVYCSVLSHVKD